MSIGQCLFKRLGSEMQILTRIASTTALQFVKALGGIRNTMTVDLSNSVAQVNMQPSDTLVSYAPDPGIFEPEYIAEKLETKAGWNFATPIKTGSAHIPRHWKPLSIPCSPAESISPVWTLPSRR
jgi:hypothetical protein